MHFHQNHCWCSRSHWDGKMFDCRYMVSIDSRRMDDYKGPREEDFKNLTYEESTTVKREVLDKIIEVPRYTINIKPEVLAWLEENVEDMKGKDYSNEENKKGWCIGDKEYRSHDHLAITVFFRRRRDAMKFIKTWSTHKKPTTYLNYFKSDRRKLVDGRLVKWERD